MDNCIKIWRDCLPELKEFMFPGNSDSRWGTPGGTFREDGPDMDLRFLVHDSQVGAIIGKAGANVKNLRMQYQLNVIKVFPVTAPFSSDRLVQMVGKFEKVFECFRVIYDTLEGQVIKGLVENYNSANYDENLTQGYGGWGNPVGGIDNTMRKPGVGLLGAPNAGDRIVPQNNRFNNANNNNRPNDQFFPKPDLNRSNSVPKAQNRFDNFSADPAAGGFDMEMEEFQMPYNKMPMQAAPEQQQQMPPHQQLPHQQPPHHQPQQHQQPPPLHHPQQPQQLHHPQQQHQPQQQQQPFPGPGIMRKRNNMDFEPDNMKRGRVGGMNNPPPAFDKPIPYDNRNEKFDKMNPYENRNEKFDKMNPYDNRNDKVNPYDNRNDLNNPYDNRNDKFDPYDNRNESSAWNRNDKFDMGNPYDNRNDKFDMGHSYDNRNDMGNPYDNRNDKFDMNNPYDNRNDKFDMGGNPYDNRNDKFDMNNPYDNRNDKFDQKPNPYDNRNEKPNFYEKPMPNRPDIGGNPMMGMNMPMNNLAAGAIVASAEKIEVSVPNTLMDVLNGMDGETLSNIVVDSGAEIVMLDNNEDEQDMDAILCLSGTKDQIEGAQYLLQICIKKSVLNL